MLPLPVIEDLDVLEAAGLHIGMSGVANPMGNPPGRSDASILLLGVS